MSASTSTTKAETYREPPCTLFTMTQYQCSPLGGKVTCWPLERVFRQCGKDKPVMEVTNRLVRSSSPENCGISSIGEKDQSDMMVDPHFLENPPKARSWSDLRHT